MGLVHFSRTSRLTSLMIDDMLCALRSVRRTWITFGSSSPPSHVGRCAWRIFQADTALPTLDRPQRARDKNLRWHFVQDAIDGTLSVYLRVTKVRSAMTGKQCATLWESALLNGPVRQSELSEAVSFTGSHPGCDELLGQLQPCFSKGSRAKSRGSPASSNHKDALGRS